VVDQQSQAVEPAICVDGLCKRYGEVEAVRDLSFSVAPGEVVGFLGPNGAGKTTTMRILTGFVPPSDGRVSIAGHDVFDEPIAARSAIGYLPETPPLYPEMKVRAYLEFVAAIKDVPRARRREAVDRVLERCGLTGVAGRVSGKLSKGFRQRVGLAQAIVHEPRVLVLDEPTVGLDPIQILEIRDLIGSLASPGEAGVRQTVILSTHILNEVEAICQRVIMLNNGRMALDQPLAELTGGGRSLEEVFARTTSRDDGAGARVAGVADGDGSGLAGAAGAART
jgi:ABC-2 type transport system ATP-binding protein